MPLTIDLSHKLALRLSEVRKNGTLPVAETRRKDPSHDRIRKRNLKRVDAVVVSSQHDENSRISRSMKR